MARLRAPFEPWRKIMLAGAVLLLAASLVRVTLGQELPTALYFVTNFVGYGLLAVGFVKRMRDRHTSEGRGAPRDHP